MEKDIEQIRQHHLPWASVTLQTLLISKATTTKIISVGVKLEKMFSSPMI